MGSFISLPPQNYNNKAVYFHTLLSILSIFQKMNRGNSSDSQQFFGFAGFVLLFFFFILEQDWSVLMILHDKIAQKLPIFNFEKPRF